MGEDDDGEAEEKEERPEDVLRQMMGGGSPPPAVEENDWPSERSPSPELCPEPPDDIDDPGRCYLFCPNFAKRSLSQGLYFHDGF